MKKRIGSGIFLQVHLVHVSQSFGRHGESCDVDVSILEFLGNKNRRISLVFKSQD